MNLSRVCTTRSSSRAQSSQTDPGNKTDDVVVDGHPGHRAAHRVVYRRRRHAHRVGHLVSASPCDLARHGPLRSCAGYLRASDLYDPVRPCPAVLVGGGRTETRGMHNCLWCGLFYHELTIALGPLLICESGNPSMGSAYVL